TSGSIPIVLSGNAAVMNVLIRANSTSSTPMQVVLRLFNAAGTLVRSDTAVATTLGTAPAFSAPSVQLLVPASVLQAGMRWQVVRDPRNVVPDDVPSNDVFPATGTQALAAVTVPPVKIRFVPIVLASHNNATGQVTDAMVPDYLRTLKSVQPVGVIEASAGTPFTTEASFGTAPSGGDATFWTRVLGELDLARIADPTGPSAHWYGVVRPPPGFNFTSYGGFAYIPSSSAATGANTRTALGVQLNWFSRPTQARDLVAHELAHNFGRRHAPCGGAVGVDPNYPVSNGTLDVAGHDVYSWANGLTTGAASVPVTTGDVMGYCFPAWSSTYTYEGVLAFRGSSLDLIQADNTAHVQRTRVLIIRGAEVRGEMHLEPAFTMTGTPSIPASGRYRVTGIDASGIVLFSRSFELATIDHAPDIRHFTLALPATPALESSLREIRVTGPAGEARLAGVGTAVVGPGSEGAPAARAARLIDGTMSVSCTAAATRGILVLDDETGSVVAVSSSMSVRAATRSRSVTVLCSDGVTTTTLTRVAPT
nr:zinc-dependent metalloprotease [Gemmatimonadota bacterium]